MCVGDKSYPHRPLVHAWLAKGELKTPCERPQLTLLYKDT